MVRCRCPRTSNIDDSVEEQRLAPNAGSTADSNANLRSDSRAECYQRSLEIDSNCAQAWNDLGVYCGGIIGGETYSKSEPETKQTN